jgi:hypothetical protein
LDALVQSLFTDGSVLGSTTTIAELAPLQRLAVSSIKGMKGHTHHEEDLARHVVVGGHAGLVSPGPGHGKWFWIGPGNGLARYGLARHRLAGNWLAGNWLAGNWLTGYGLAGVSFTGHWLDGIACARDELRQQDPSREDAQEREQREWFRQRQHARLIDAVTGTGDGHEDQ